MGKKLDWLRRFIATALGFLFWGVAGTLFQLYLYPYAKNYKKNSLATQLKVRRLVSKIWAYFIRYLTISGVLEVKYQGFERLGCQGQLVLVNHPSLLDVVLVLAKAPELNCIVKKELLNNPTMRNQILACGFLPNTESLELLEECDEVLKEQALLLFPEGTRTGWDGEVKLNRGAVSIGLRSASVITPIVIRMNPLNFKKGQPWYQLPKKRIQYELIVGEDINPQDWLAEKPLPIASRRLTEYLQHYFNSQTKDDENDTRTTT
ncbi:1-acyl-sn-glycerol-3-phosphate acyltransferase [Rodentibacter mrazii]|uniref:1-acyl-sn-glycerol-3-phosphate acyltransferase n=1 Tax=Rodentibacter mrazii TaxID=1908257 RepID=A0A1V3IIC2_9PAST|nr:lysophospholipid acyltransferase family protein [Rodentibacter mrazii]OOF40526.1 1-acyl-sn-glycerol-3-phosphate acyltransferase [Rodentibacter mrazii]